MSPPSRGASGILGMNGRHLLAVQMLSCIVFIVLGTQEAQSLSVPDIERTNNKKQTPDDIEAYVKTLEYEATNGGGGSVNDLVKIDFNLLSDGVLETDLTDGLQEEFEVVDASLGETPDPSRKDAPVPTSRQLSLIYQGVYAPDSRFNAFADGVMVNMVAEMKRKRMDPLYFRVYDRGIVEHVAARTGRSGRRDEQMAVSSVFNEDTTNNRQKRGLFDRERRNTPQNDQAENSRQGRQRGNAIGGGVIRGLTNTKRFGNAEVQIAGNMTLVRGHWLIGPLDIIVDYRAATGITRVRTGIQAVQFDTLTSVDRFGAEMSDFKIISPLFNYMPYYGNRTLTQQKTTEQVVRHLFSNESFMTLLMKDSFEIASYDKIIPQFGTESNYYSVLKYLFDGTPGGNNGRASVNLSARGISMPGVPADIAAYLAKAAKSAIGKLG